MKVTMGEFFFFGGLFGAWLLSMPILAYATYKVSNGKLLFRQATHLEKEKFKALLKGSFPFLAGSTWGRFYLLIWALCASSAVTAFITEAMAKIFSSR